MWSTAGKHYSNHAGYYSLPQNTTELILINFAMQILCGQCFAIPNSQGSLRGSWRVRPGRPGKASLPLRHL